MINRCILVFGTLNHGVLLEKMKYFGVWAALVKWFESYLSNGKFYVCIDNVLFWGWNFKGSILRSLLFLLNVNYLSQSLSEAGFYFYNDRTCIFYQHEDVKKIENVLNKEFSLLCQQLIDSKLSIHFRADETKCILFLKTRGLREINTSFVGHSIKQ